MSDKKPSHPIRSIVTLVISVAIFVCAGWLFLNRQYAIDQVSVWAYQAPANIEAIEERVAFTDKGKFYFYATQPVVNDADGFNQNCPRQETGSPVLGCYAMGRIYVYDITNEQLDGMEEVTAAHEMLHAVWERQSESEKARIGALLETAYQTMGDAELKTRMDYYKRTEPGEFQNELHSILGTEMPNLGTELETYYAKYFKDRQVVLGLHAQYSSVFQGLQNQADALFLQLEALGTNIETRTTQYNSDIAQLSADIQAFNERATNGGFDSQVQFNRERAALVARTDTLGNERDAINADIETYKSKYDEYQTVASQIEILNKSIDSFTTLDPAPSL